MNCINLRTLTVLLLASMLMISCQVAPNTSSASSEPAFTDQGQAKVSDDVSDPNILQIAQSSADHTTLATAIEAAEAQNILVNQGPLTVFAPNNAAFDKLPAGTVEDLLKPENKSTLAKIITSHASPGTFTMERLTPNTKIYLATGQYVDVEIKEGATYVNGARILGTVEATNGIVHVIDQVFLF